MNTRPELLSQVLAEDPPPFAVLHRPGSDRYQVDVISGEVSTVDSIAEIPLSGGGRAGSPNHDVLAILPYRQISERGFAAADDACPLITMSVGAQEKVPIYQALERIPDMDIEMSNGHFDVDDEDYAHTVKSIINDEIGVGEGANFVIKRSFVADISDYTAARGLAFFRRILERENSAYWTFIIYTGTQTFVGASPERHVSLSDKTAVMNPISGTYRYPDAGPKLPELLDFLSDDKETDELYMVLDEELKMMGQVCDGGGRVVGPYLKEMAKLAHTEYFIEGHSTRDPREILRETMFAPTVTGSPLESACRVIEKYEPEGRGYYSGVAALIGTDEYGQRAMDSAILIRTANIDDSGTVRIGVGATLVRHSDPLSEVAETRAKASALLSALESDGTMRFGSHPDVRRALEGRNKDIAKYWLAREDAAHAAAGEIRGKRVLIVDAEDTFTSMIGHQLRSLGLVVDIRRFDEKYSVDDYDLVVAGPGPGDPQEYDHPKIAHLRSLIQGLLDSRRPFLAVCLSHQVLSLLLGLNVTRREWPNQGVQKKVELFGQPALVGFYNTFAARSGEDTIYREGVDGPIEVSRDSSTGEVHGLRGPGFTSLQFHAESVLTQDGVGILGEIVTYLSANSGRHLEVSP